MKLGYVGCMKLGYVHNICY